MCKSQINCRRPSDIIKEMYDDLLFSALNYHHPVSTKNPPWPEVKLWEKRECFHCPVERRPIVQNNLDVNGIF